jgi:hypothetical protein
MRPLHRLATAVAVTALMTALTGGSASAQVVTPVVIKPAKLPRGADVALAHVEGSTVVDGATRIDVPGYQRVELLGRSGTSYVVVAFGAQGQQSVLRASPEGTLAPLVQPTRTGDLVVLSHDGTRLAQATPAKRFTRTRVRVWDTASGATTASKAFPGLVSVLDLNAAKVVLGGFDSGTLTWRTASDAVRTLTARMGVVADLRTNRLSTLDGDPYDGGCTVVSTLSGPRTSLWKSCAERVESFSPDGRRMATVDLLADGIGPSQVLVRGIRGSSHAVYRIRGYFGLLSWESSRTLLLDSFARVQSANVRCTRGACERASELTPTPAYRRAS